MAALFVGSMLVAACDGNDDGAPTILMNGAKAAELPVDLEGVESPAVLTSFVVRRVEEIEGASAVAGCLQQHRDDLPHGPIVMRVGVSGESVTFHNRLWRGLYGCDNSQGAREEGRRWCGGAFGQLHGGHLRDPRLDMGACTTRGGGLVGFAWIEPGPGAKYVVVEQRGYAEVYEVGGGLPVRVTTTSDVEIEGSRATFELSEHDADGRAIRRYRVDARVAG
jgi:hypothetical protein